MSEALDYSVLPANLASGTLQVLFYCSLLQLDFNVHASWQVELHQRVNRFVGRVNDVHQALVGADF